VKGPRIVVSRFVSLVITTGLLAGLTGMALAPAQAPAPDTRPHILLVPDEPKAESVLSGSDARVVARYSDFSLVEAVGEDDRRLRDAGAARRDDMRRVRLGGGTVDPLVGRASLASKGPDPGGEELVLLQFVGPVKHAWLERLRETGGWVVGYAAQNAYIVHARGRAVDRLAGLVGTDTAVRAVVPVQAGDKFPGSPPAGPVAVQTVAGERGEAARDRARALGPSLQGESQVAGVTTQVLRLDGDEVEELATDPGVLFVEPWSEPELLDERASQIAAANLTAGVPTQPGYLGWLESEGFSTSTFGFTIDVSDEGFDNGSETAPTHADFYENGIKPGTDRVEYAHNYGDDSTARDCGGHGTNVASIATGFNDQPDLANNDSAGFNHGLGVAPQARLGVSKIFECDGNFDLNGDSFTDVVSDAYGDGARISNNSWGFSSNPNRLGEYTADSRLYDALVRDAQPSVPGNQEMVLVFAAGNSGEDVSGEFNEGYATVSPPATAKNVITVGASENVRSIGMADGCGVPDSGANHANDIIDFSSRGPTDDQRLKPELVAPGSHMLGARPTHGGYSGDGVCNQIFPSGSLYNLVSGTSQATPVVAGAAALIRDWYRREHGGGTDVPSPALTKAILANTAADVAGGSDGKGSTVPSPPSMDAGWGRVNLAGVFGGPAREFVDQTELLEASGETVVRSYEVPAAGQPVRVTLAWTDALPGSSGGDAFVNDLDLEVSAGGRRYLGNVVSGGLSVTGGNPDARNNLESVVLPAGAAAKFAVKVRGTTIAGDGVPGNGPSTDFDQDFALVVSNANEIPSPVLAGDLTTLDDPVPGADGDDALEPGESFTLDQSVRNDGDSPATGVNGTMSANPGITFTPTSRSYGTISPDGVATNSAPFTGQVSGAATCGENVDATLSLTTGEGPETIPIVLPTGAAGTPDPQSITHTPGLTIPDDSSLGVTSTLTISSPGRIKDLDVRIGRITHGWVGDLVIELKGPDGTTVTLARHPGGPDNNGNNFVETVFDDEAPTNISLASAPYTGNFRPQSDQLSRFDGKDKQGNWQLRVRDLFESDTGRLEHWGTSTRSAVCDPPQTVLIAGPPEGQVVASTSATFEFTASTGPGLFECSLDGQEFKACPAPKTYENLTQGLHTFAVRALDGDGDADQSPAARTWTVDTLGPAVDIDAPASGSTLSNPTPTLSGSIGTAARDLQGVAVRIHSGTSSAGAIVQDLTPMVSGDNWAATAETLPEGTYTARAEQADSLGNVGASTSTFTIDLPDHSPSPSPSPDPPPPPVAPSFLLAPAEERLADALAGRVVVTAACASACEARAKLTVSAQTSRSLGLGAKPTALGSGVKRLARKGTASVRVRLTARARAALRGTATTRATLRATLNQGGQSLVLSRTVSLLRSGGPAHVAARGLKLWTVCSESCPLSGKVTLSAKTARRIGLRPKGSARMSIASGRTTAPAGKPARLTLKVRKGAKKALRRASKVGALLETVAGPTSGPQRRAKRTLTLRR
jgi:subtilisin-like proprotein convertase family protein